MVLNLKGSFQSTLNEPIENISGSSETPAKQSAPFLESHYGKHIHQLRQGIFRSDTEPSAHYDNPCDAWNTGHNFRHFMHQTVSH